MKNLGSEIAVYLWQGTMDMRKSFDTLTAFIAEQLKESAVNGKKAYVFFSRCRSRVKILYWDGDGFAIWHKRLEAGSYRVSKVEAYEVITAIDLEKILSGTDFSRIKLNKNADNGLYDLVKCGT